MASNAHVRDEYEKNYEPWDGTTVHFHRLLKITLALGLCVSFVILENQLSVSMIAIQM